MRAIEVFRARHQFAREIFYDDLWDDYTEDQLRTPPNPATNSLAWNLWHVARVEDSGIMRFVAREPQLYEREGWREKLNITVDHFGYGMSAEEAQTLNETIDLGALRTYFEDVSAQTIDLLDRLSPEQLDETLSTEEVREVMLVEGVAPSGLTMDAFPYPGWTRLEALYHFSVTHYYWHGGEVRTIESLIRSNSL
jgi:hypothetical protein